ncbi:glutamine-hydrolyzing GMP synthase [Rudaeicoccus suwonensis]|uniref:GMP synthase [glutamine-hydrolyzing] n=1 Tax=Rudaeicoccus suwonensis TaxID=657409 RepID=A0A561E8G0_9MICO|nr:glutamine-hydrolyzing GMP synthase [Rudaeicoccus suwonensis]TWE11912.1 GMP synthase (glutamine-hydrolysing) [Rudaeicoccus suwonensis]
MTAPLQQHPVVVLDFGAQYAQLIARRVREAALFSEVMPHTASTQEILNRQPAAIILSGGPSSVYDEGAPSLDPALLDAGVPVFGICYGFQAMVRALGGTVEHTGLREYGATQAQIDDTSSTLFNGQPGEQSVWMSHGDSASLAPEGIRVTATTPGAAVAAIEDDERQLYGVQWHPEVLHSTFGQRVLENFLLRGARLEPDWTPAAMADELIDQVRDQVGDGRALCALSGGVDSSVAAALVQRAIGDQLTCVFVDHGLLRDGEAEQVKKDFVAATGVDLVVIDATEQFLTALAGVSDPEQKRKIIGAQFIRCFEQAARDIVHDRGDDQHPVKFLVQGTLYPDVVESGGGTGAANIKSHHNVGGLPDDLQFALIEPLRLLFKDEVRQVGLELGVPEEIVHRQPFPGPGLGIRIVGEVTAERLEILRAADKIARAELTAAGLDRDIWQCPVVLLADVRSVGVQGDGRTYGHPIVLRPVSSEDAMTADWTRLPYDVLARISNRITNEVADVNRVVLDVTSKPPGTIEWE